MAAPLDNIRVLEVANWLAAPAATALMADMGAEVIKVEPPAGDIYRAFILRSSGINFDFQTNFAFEHDNRGKRSIVVDLEKPGAAELVLQLAAQCDVFVTNLMMKRRKRYGLTWEAVRVANPRIVYASLTGYGDAGPDEDRPGFDFAAFWAKSGIMGLLGEPDAPPPLCRGGQGDHATALNILASVLAALRLRDQTGAAQQVETTLQASGMYTIASDFAAALASRQNAPRISRKSPISPIWNSYECADGRWVLLVNPTPYPTVWPSFARFIGRPELAEDERWDDIMKLRAHAAMLTAEVEAAFREHDYAWWAKALDDLGLIWAPVARMTEMIEDPQVRAMGWITQVEHPQFGPYELLDTPFKIHGTDTGVRGPAPTLGADTFAVLGELGVTPARVEELAVAGVLG